MRIIFCSNIIKRREHDEKLKINILQIYYINFIKSKYENNF